MDMRSYYQNMRQIEESIAEPHVVLVSVETPDGGKADVRTEVPRAVAARYLVDKRARLATKEEAQEFRERQSAARREAQRRESANRIQFAVVPESELTQFKGSSRDSK